MRISLTFKKRLPASLISKGTVAIWTEYGPVRAEYMTETQIDCEQWRYLFNVLDHDVPTGIECPKELPCEKVIAPYITPLDYLEKEANKCRFEFSETIPDEPPEITTTTTTTTTAVCCDVEEVEIVGATGVLEAANGVYLKLGDTCELTGPGGNSIALIGVGLWGVYIAGSLAAQMESGDSCDPTGVYTGLESGTLTVSEMEYNARATAYIEAIQDEGIEYNLVKRSATNQFDKKYQDLYSTVLERLHFWCWGNEQAHLINYPTATKIGTFHGINHTLTSGIYGNGTDEYYDWGESLDSTGIAGGDIVVGCLVTSQDDVEETVDDAFYLGVEVAAPDRVSIKGVGGLDPAISFDYADLPAKERETEDWTGLHILNHKATGDESTFATLTMGGVWEVAYEDAVSLIATSITQNFYSFANNNAGTPEEFSSARQGLIFLGNSIPSAQVQEFTYDLMNLWNILKA